MCDEFEISNPKVLIDDKPIMCRSLVHNTFIQNELRELKKHIHSAHIRSPISFDLKVTSGPRTEELKRILGVYNMSCKSEKFGKELRRCKNQKQAEALMKKYRAQQQAHEKKANKLREAVRDANDAFEEHMEEGHFDMQHAESMFIDKMGSFALKEIKED